MAKHNELSYSKLLITLIALPVVYMAACVAITSGEQDRERSALILSHAVNRALLLQTVDYNTTPSLEAWRLDADAPRPETFTPCTLPVLDKARAQTGNNYSYNFRSCLGTCSASWPVKTEVPLLPQRLLNLLWEHAPSLHALVADTFVYSRYEVGVSSDVWQRPALAGLVNDAVRNPCRYLYDARNSEYDGFGPSVYSAYDQDAWQLSGCSTTNETRPRIGIVLFDIDGNRSNTILAAAAANISG